MKKILLLIDGSSLAYRSYFAFKDNPLITSKGKPTSAVFGFARSLKKVLEELKVDYAAVCFDLPEPTFRKKKFAEYKAQRKKMPDELSSQLPCIKELCQATGFHVLSKSGYEADDVIATLVEKTRGKDIDTVVFTMDKDLMQLVSKSVTILNMHGKGKEWIDPEKVEEKFGIPPDKLGDYLAIRGDSSDNIPGLKGVGKKTAAQLLKNFISLEDIFLNLNSIKNSKIQKKLEGKKEEALKWRKLIKLKKDVPLDLDLPDLNYKGIDKNHLKKILKELEFYSLIEEWLEKEKGTLDYNIVNSIEERGKTLCILQRKGKIYLSSGKSLMIAEVDEAIPQLGKFEGGSLVLEDAKKVAHILGRYPEGEVLDLAIMHYLLYPNRKKHTLDRILLEQGMTPANEESATVLMKKAAKNSCKALKDNNLWKLYKEIEQPLIPVLFRMEKNGILFDTELLKRLRISINAEIEEVKQDIYKLAGVEFNLRSPKQLSKILFERLGLPVIKTTTTGFSTDVEVLNVLWDKHPIISEILNFRELDKLKNSYLNPLIESVDKKTNRIHPEFQQTVASTGRITTINPNLQTLPIRTERGRRIRKAVISPPDHLILSCDYSQIELRILAHLSGDEKLLEDFEEGLDIHTSTACRIFGLESGEITPEKRRRAKAINFGIVYGISPYGLSKQLGIPPDEANKIIERYYNNHPGVEGWQKETIDNAIDSGFVTTIFGRKRWIPELNSPRQKEYGKRITINTPIQGSAADIIKKAMIKTQSELEKRKLKTKMILQIHDELLFEVPEEEKEEITDLVVPIMESAGNLLLPLKVDYNFGRNWDEAH